MFSRRLTRPICPLYLFLALSCVLSSRTAAADSHTAYGVSLPVDEIQAVDAQNTKVTLLGRTAIVANSELDKTVLQTFAANKEAFVKIDASVWVRLTATAMTQQGGEKVAPVVERLLTDSSKDESLCKLLKGWLAEKGAVALAKPLLQSAQFEKFNDKCKLPLILEAGRADVNWFRANALAQGYRIKEDLLDYGLSEWSKALSAGDVDLAGRTAELLAALTEGSGNQGEKLKLATDLVRTFLSKGESQNLSDLLPLISLRNNEKPIAPAITPVIVRLLHNLAEQALKNNESEKALTFLSHVGVDERTPTTHDLVSRSIAALPPGSNVLSGKQIKELLYTISKNDPKVAGEIHSFYERKLRGMRTKGIFAEDRAVFDELLDFRPDPNPANDELRLEHALLLLGRNDRTGAQEVLADVQTDLSFMSRIELLMAGLYGNVLLYVLILCIPLILKLTLSIVRPPKRTVTISDDSITPEDMLHNLAGDARSHVHGKAFVTRGSSRQLDPLVEEYLECLKVFELDESADFRTIKMAYRNAVKEIHPDLNVKNQTPEAAERFIRLTKAYDRIRELQKHLNISQA